MSTCQEVEVPDILIGNRLRGREQVPCGRSSPTLLIASVGSSAQDDLLDEEIAKAVKATELGASAVTDHSFYGDIPRYHRALTDQVDALISAVTCYEMAVNAGAQRWHGLSPRMPVDVVRDQLERGIDMLTVHATFLKEDMRTMDETGRLIPTTSKGGGIVARYIRETGLENPYFENFDELLELFKHYGAALSLGTTFRPATVCDSWDDVLLTETQRMGMLVERAQSVGVPVMVEGFGHAPLNEMSTLINLATMYCHDAPYRILPMATDRALGFDHLSGAIATAMAVMAGASAVTAMSRAEHIGLPDIQDLEEAIISTKIAIASGELGRGWHFDEERQMSRTRWAQGGKGDWTVAINPPGAEDALRVRGRLEDQRVQCGMCEDFCGIAAGNATVKLGPKHA